MVKQLLPLLGFIILLGSCSSLKPLNFTGSRQLAAAATPAKTSTEQPAKFLEEISVTPLASSGIDIKSGPKEPSSLHNLQAEENIQKTDTRQAADIYASRNTEVEAVSQLQLKYAILMNTEVEQLQNKVLLEGIDEWYGTKYRMGGTTKKGVDCSAFVCAIFAGIYGVTLPRMARDQYRFSRRISRTELKEGDLLFFNTRGGVSHVGIYLQNNKFVHASTSKGVTISDMFENYYLKRFIGAGRIENKQGTIAQY